MIEYLTTNVANGHRFVRDHKQHVRWLIDEQEWRVWDGRRAGTDTRPTRR